MNQKTGIAIDAKGQKIGRATMRPDGSGIDVQLSVRRSEVQQPVRIVWDTLVPGGFDYHPGAVIA